jgi:hypothetical protein
MVTHGPSNHHSSAPATPNRRRRRLRYRYWLGPETKGPSMVWLVLPAVLTIVPMVLIFLAVYVWD